MLQPLSVATSGRLAVFSGANAVGNGNLTGGDVTTSNNLVANIGTSAGNDIVAALNSGSTTTNLATGIALSTTGNISTTGSGTITSAGALTVSSGGAGVTGGVTSTVSGTTAGLTIANSGSGNDITGTALALTSTGHVVTSSTIVTPAASLSGDATSATAAGSDVAGVVTINYTGTVAATASAKISFANTYTTAPYVVIVPASSDIDVSGATKWYVTSTGTDFTITFNDAGASDPGTKLVFNYIVVR